MSTHDGVRFLVKFDFIDHILTSFVSYLRLEQFVADLGTSCLQCVYLMSQTGVIVDQKMILVDPS